MVVEGENCFPKFERWIEKGYPSVYEEEIYHQSTPAIGLLLVALGVLLFIFSNLILGDTQIIGLSASFLGILILVAGLVRYRLQLRQYCYRGLTRNTISDAIMYLDTRVFPPERVEMRIPYYMALHPSFYNPDKFRNEFRGFVINTRGQVTWPSRIVNELKWDIEVAKQGLRPCSMTFFSLTIILIVIIAYLVSLADWTWMLAIFLLGFCTLQGIWMYIKYLFDKKSLFRDSWINQLVSSETVELEDSIQQIFNLLQAEFPYPLRFYLTGEYPQLVYTGREVTSPNKTRLKEAVLYPEIKGRKEESTGA